jgi:hypothetical protein
MENKGRVGSLVGGLILVGFGLVALLTQWVPGLSGLNFWGSFWPLIIVGFGALFFVVMLSSGRQAAPLAIPGSIFAGIGLLMLIQNFTGHWESWAYGWTVIIMSVGIGIFLMGTWASEVTQREAGRRVFSIGLILFVIFGAFFEMIFNTMPLSNVVFPIALIVLGGWLILARSGAFGRKAEPIVAEQETKKKRTKK